MNRPMVITELHAMVHSRLFSRRPWLPDQEACCAMFRKLHDLGLDEEVPGQPGSTQATNLGTELSMHLMMVFMGLWDDRGQQERKAADGRELGCGHPDDAAVTGREPTPPGSLEGGMGRG